MPASFPYPTDRTGSELQSSSIFHPFSPKHARCEERMPFTPPATKDGFAFAHGDFFAEASGRHQHRRATAAELRTFADGNVPAHWFEAQLTHYGLPPCETSSDARRALLDALDTGRLQVPAHVARIEAELEEEWNKKDREEHAAAMDRRTEGNNDGNTNRNGQAEDARSRPHPFRPGPGARDRAQVPLSSFYDPSAPVHSVMSPAQYARYLRSEKRGVCPKTWVYSRTLYVSSTSL